jgi:bifunctional ADP-heptose synthase (sugar kinase/adenylyltransferase)
MNLLGETDLPASDTGRRLSRKIKGTLILTRGSDGMDIFQKGNLIQHFSALSPDVVDTSGAGDTVSAILTTMLAVGASVEDASDIANRAAAIAVSKRGVATISQEELLETL